MATGIQTGIRRGTRASATTAQQPGAFATIRDRWMSLSRGAKSAIVGSVVLLQLLMAGAGVYSHQTGLVDLYPTKLQTNEVPDISRALLAAGIEHEVAPTDDGLLVNRKERARARAVLASENLPLHLVLTAEARNSSLAQGASERRAQEQRVLEGEITMALRDVDGIQDARVKLALPERSYFQTDKDLSHAAVTLTVQSGHVFDREAISGLVHLVAFSVPGLSAENVQLLDTKGRDLSAQIPRDSEGGLQVSGAHFEVRSTEEKRMQDKVQTALDEMFPGRTKVLVNVDMDFSTLEHRLYTPGSEKDDGMVRDSFQLVTEMLGSKQDKKDFQNRKESVNYKFMENYTASLAKQARIERISATVFADGISTTQAASLEMAVNASLGMTKERGDFVYIDPTPWDHQMAAETGGAWTPPPAAESGGGFPLTASSLLLLFGGQAALMAGGLATFLYVGRRHRPAAAIEDRPLAHLRATGIVDHGRGKAGDTSADFAATRVQSTELLEGIVRDRPTQVADLLRSTWLS